MTAKEAKAVEELATELWVILGPTVFSKLDLRGIAHIIIALGYKRVDNKDK